MTRRIWVGLMVMCAAWGCSRLQGSGGGATAAKTNFDSPSTAAWREALIHLSHEGAAALPQMEARAARGDAETNRRVKLWLEAALRRSLRWEEVQPFARVAALGQPAVDEARAAFTEAGTKRVLEAGEPISIAKHGGFAVPAAVEALENGTPAARVEATRHLSRMRVRHLRAVLERHAADSSRATVSYDDYGGSVSVEQLVKQALTEWDREIPQVPCLRFEEDVSEFGSDLVNGMRQSKSAIRATTSQAYWDLARPAWVRWWSLTPDGGLGPTEREVWLNSERAQEGFQLERKPHPRARSYFHVVGPAQTRCTVSDNGGAWASDAPLPLDLERDPVGVVKVACELVGGGHFEKQFAYNAGEEWTVTLLAGAPQ